MNTCARGWEIVPFQSQPLLTGDVPLHIQRTPFTMKFFNRFADAITCGPDGRRYFVEPAVETMTMKDLIEALDPRK
jgi:hypothetical protein